MTTTSNSGPIHRAPGGLPRLWFLSAACLLAVLGGAGWYFAASRGAVARGDAERSLAGIVELKAGQIETWLSERRGDAALVRSSLRVHQLLAAPQDPAVRAAAAAYMAELVRAYDYELVAAFDATGALILTTATNLLETHPCASGHARSALSASDNLLIDLHRSQSRAPVHLSVLSAIRLKPSTNAVADGVVLLVVDPSRFLFPFIQTWPVPSPTAETLLVRREGDEVVCLNETRHRAGTDLNLRIPVTDTNLPIVQAVLGRRGLLAGPDYRQAQVVAVAHAIEGTPWTLVGKVDQDEIDAPARREVWQVGLMIGLAALAAAMGTWLLWRRQRVRLLEGELADRRQVEAALRESEERYRLVSENSSDVIWLLDLATDRFTYVSPSVERLRGFTVAEVLEQRPADVLAPESYRLIQEGLPVRLAAFRAGDTTVRTQVHEVWQTCRDGSTVPTEVATTLIAGPDRRVTHIQGVSRGIAERKATEEALRRSEAKFVSLFQFGPDAVFLVTLPERRIVEVNCAGVRLSGFALEDLVGRTIDEIDPWANGQDRERFLAAVRNGQRIVDFEAEFVIKSGERRRCLVSSQVIHLEGQPHLLSAIRDITAQREAEAQVRLQDARLRLALEAAEMVTWELDVATGSLSYSTNLPMLAGSTDLAPYLSVEVFLQQVHPEDRDRAASAIARSIQTGAAFDSEYRVRLPDGSWRWLLGKGHPTRGPEGRVDRVMGVSVDITERKRAEAALSRSEAQYRLLAENSEDFISVHDPQERRTYISPSYYRATGWTPEEVAQSAWDARLHPDDLAALGRARAANLAGQSTVVEHRVRCRDGTWIWVESKGTPFHGPDGRVQQLLLAARDITERKRAEEALRQTVARVEQLNEVLRANEQRFRAYVEQAADAIFVVDDAGRIIDANQRACESLGYSREELLALRVGDLEPAEAPPEQDRVQRLPKPSPQDTIRGRHRRKDGSSFPVEVRVGTVGLEGRSVSVWLARDVSERELVEARSRVLRDLGFAAAAATRVPEALELCLQAALRLSGMDAGGIYLREPETGALELKAHTGLSASFVSSVRHLPADEPRVRWARAGRTFHGVIGAPGLPAGTAERMEGLKAVSLLPVLYEGELVAVLNVASHTLEEVPESARHPLETVASLLSGLLARLQAQEALRRVNADLEDRVAERTRELVLSEQRHRLLVEAIPDIIFYKSVEGVYLGCNPAFARLVGRPEAEVIGLTDRDLFPPGVADTFRACDEQMMASLAPRRNEEWVEYPDGRRALVDTLRTPYRGPDGRLVGVLGVSRDITDRKRSEEQLRQAKEAAEAANRAKSVFLTSMSHEIRTPMNAILGFSQLLLRDPQSTPQQQHQVRIITRSGEHLLTLLNDILEMARIESGRLVLNPGPCDLPRLLADLEAMFLLRAQSKRLQFAVEGAASLPRVVEADETKLRQVLINLLANAVKFTPAGGTVTLRAIAVPDPDGGWRLEADVSDSGAGIPAADLPHLFQPFYQTAAGRQTAGGTGLGLAISREFARLMGGDLTVRSEPDRGSTFRLEARLRVPDVDALPTPRAPTRHAAGLASPQASCRVLVVDDEEDNRALLEELLGPLGFETRSAVDGAAALELAATWKPHLVVLDLRTRGLDGCEIAARLRAAGGVVPKILVLSATVFREDEQRALAAGADVFLAKPFLEGDLLEQIRRLTGIEYRYQEAAAPPGGFPTPSTPTPELAEFDAVRRLPPPLVEALRQAVEAADYHLILGLTEQVATREAALGARLRELTHAFDYATVQLLLAGRSVDL